MKNKKRRFHFPVDFEQTFQNIGRGYVTHLCYTNPIPNIGDKIIVIAKRGDKSTGDRLICEVKATRPISSMPFSQPYLKSIIHDNFTIVEIEVLELHNDVPWADNSTRRVAVKGRITGP